MEHQTIFLTHNAPQFSSEEFKRFAFKWQFQHITSSPYYPEGNGTAESLAKTMMKKTKEAKSDIYRNTSKQDIRLSPAQSMIRRRTKTLVPRTQTLLAPKTVKPNPVAVNKRKMSMRNNYDSHAKVLKSLKVGDPVMMQPVLPNQHV